MATSGTTTRMPTMRKPKVGQEWFTCEVDSREDEETETVTYTGRVLFHTWIVVTIGRKYITLYRKCPDTWITRKGESQWATRIDRYDQKRCPKAWFPAEYGLNSKPVVFSTRRLALLGEIARSDESLRYWEKQAANDGIGQHFVDDLKQEIPILRRKLDRMAAENRKERKKQAASAGRALPA